MTPMQPERTDAETALGAALPSRRDEAWKWTDLRGALSGDAGGITRPALPKFVVPKGIKISEGEGHRGAGAMAGLAAQFGGKSWDIYVPAGFNSEDALAVAHQAAGHSRIAIMVGAGASLSLSEHYSGPAGGFSNLDVQIHLANGASLTRAVLHDDPADHTRMAFAHIAMEKGAKLTQHSLSFGAGLSRLETRVSGEGAKIEADIHGAYLLSGKRHCDMTSHISLSSPDAKLRQSVKGVVTDSARGVFQGKFWVARTAQHTDAQMRHDALMLSDRGEVRAKPELEIYADDVACAHGNTLGQLDERALFYMRQRGIPLAGARALLTEAFVSSAFDGLTSEALREGWLGRVRAWLEANL